MYRSKYLIIACIPALLFLSILSFSLNTVLAIVKVDNLYFSLKVPDTWTYAEYSNTGIATFYGRGPVNYLILAPSKFASIIIKNPDDDRTEFEKISEGGAFAEISQDTDYSIKNAPLESYVTYKTSNDGSFNLTSQQDTIVGKEKAIKVEANGTDVSTNNIKEVRYMVLHHEDAYYFLYAANTNDYNKYLQDFEQMVKSFRFK